MNGIPILSVVAPLREICSGNEKLTQLVREIVCGQKIVTMERCKKPLQREFCTTLFEIREAIHA